jgi:hypothetical protein
MDRDAKIYMIADDGVPLLEEMGYIVPQTN